MRGIALLAMSVLVACLSVVWLAGAISRGWQREGIRELVETLADRQLARHGLAARLRIGALEGPLLPTLALRDVRLEVSGETVARVAHVELQVAPLALLRSRTLVLERVEIEGAELAFRRDSAHAWPWEAWRPGPAPRSLAIEVRSLVVARAQLALAFEEGRRPSRLAGPLELQAAGFVLPREGPPRWPTLARGHWQLLASRVADRALRSADLAFVLHGSRLRVAPARLDAEFGRARLEATADLAGWLDRGLPAALSLECDADGLDLGVLLARPELSGAVAGHATLRVERPGGATLHDLAAEGLIELRSSQVGGLRIDAAELRARLADGRFELAHAAVDSSLGRLVARGRGSVERADAVDVDLALRDLAELAAFAGHPGALTGAAQLSLRFSGPWAEPVGEASLQASHLQVGHANLGALVAGLHALGGGRLVLDPLRISGGDWPVVAEGPVSLRRVGAGVRLEAARLRLLDAASLTLAGDLDRHAARGLRLELRGLPLARIGPLAGLREALGGRLDATLAADGAWPRPALQGTLDWEAPSVGEARAERLDVSFATERSRLQGQASLQASGRRLGVARFAVPWDEAFDPARLLERPGTRLSAEAHDFDLAFLGDLMPPAVRGLRGRADLRLDLAGGTPRPTLSGDLALAEVGFELPALGQRLGPLAGRVTLTDDVLRLDSLRLTGGAQGEAVLGGRVALAGFAPISAELELALHRFPFQYAGRLRADLDGRILVSGPVDALVARGELALGRARYFLTGQRSPVAAEITVHNDPAQAGSTPSGPVLERAPGLYRRSRIDVRIEIPPGARVVGQGAEVRIRGLLHAGKPPLRQLALEGSVETLGGVYRIRGKSFDVEPGRVVFTGRPDFDPELDLRARRRVRDVEVIARVRGRGSNPKVRLESDPPLPENDLLALLLFGRTREELGRAESAAFQSFLAETAGGAALAELRTLTGLPLPLDVFEVRAAEESGAPTLGLGAHVTRDVFVHFGKGFGETAGSEVGLDWRFAPPHWSVETRSTTDRGSSADLVWTYDY